MKAARIVVLTAAFTAPAAFAADATPRFDDQRLFTTAAQREHLDALREATPSNSSPGTRRQGVPPPLEQKAPKKESPSVALQGFIRRSNGRAAVWANGQTTLVDELMAQGIHVHSGQIEGRTVVVTLPDGRSVRLAPGQVWDPDAGRVVDSYRR